MKELTSRERMARMYAHKDADRVPIMDSPWGATIERWHREGMPEGASYVDYFGIDHTPQISVDNSPRYETKTLEETDEYVIYTSSFGVTMKQWKHAASTPEFLKFTIVDPDSWVKAKERITPDKDRVNWKQLERNYPRWKKQDLWIYAGLWFGFDATHSWIVGTERILVALLEHPEWCMDMFSHFLEVNLALLDMVWDAGYKFDGISWPDDMGYKGHQFFSKDMYREMMKPYHKRAIEWAHAKGIKAHLHSCGYVAPLIPELLDIGLDALNPLEVKAGMDPIALKKEYGDKLVLHGGINAVLWDKPDEIKAEIEKVLPEVKKNGGYIFSSDHSIPSSVSLNDFKGIVEVAKRVGSYA
jgi:uroporphyrinogen decarboxylase